MERNLIFLGATGGRVKFTYLQNAIVSLFLATPAFASTFYSITGNHADRGSFHGLLEIRENGSVIRVVEYDKPSQGLKVQEVWTGAWVNNLFEFNVSMSSFIYKADDYQLPLAQATQKSTIRIAAAGTSSYVGVDGRPVQETVSGPVAADPRFLSNEQTSLRDVSNGGPPLLVRPLVKIAKNKIGWNHDAFVQKMDSKPGCEDKKAKSVEDFTDQYFLSQNKDVVRVYNEVANPLSIAEGQYRRAAFVNSVPQKIAFAEKNMDQHINRLGMNVYTNQNGDGTLSTVVDGDSALWTGEYVAYLSSSYLRSPKPDTLAKIKKSANAIMTLIEVFQNEGEFARTLEDYKEGEALEGHWAVVNTSLGKIKAMRGGNNDMYKGVIIGLLAARSAVPSSDTEFHQRLAGVSRMILNLKVAAKSGDNRNLALALASLANNDGNLKSQFLNQLSKGDIGDLFDGGFYWNGISDYSGINLGMVEIYTLYLVGQQMQAPEVLQKAQDKVNKFKKEFAPLKHALVNMVAAKINPANISVDEKNSANQTLASIPYPRPAISVAYDHSERKEFCLSPMPARFWKAYSGKTYPTPYYYQSLTTFPEYQSAGISSNYSWKDAYFEFKGEWSKTLTSSPVDLLFAATLMQ
jgi:hypothetical protein